MAPAPGRRARLGGHDRGPGGSGRQEGSRGRWRRAGGTGIGSRKGVHPSFYEAAGHVKTLCPLRGVVLVVLIAGDCCWSRRLRFREVPSSFYSRSSGASHFARGARGEFEGWGRHLRGAPRTAAKETCALTHPSNLRETGGTHRLLLSLSPEGWRRGRAVGSVVGRRRSRRGAARRECRPSGGRARRQRRASRAAQRCGGPTGGGPPPVAGGAGGWRRRLGSTASASGRGRPW